jgi:hypothetical protein
MSLMTLVRSIGAVVIVWTLVAIGIGASGARLPGSEATAVPSVAPPTVDAIPRDRPSGDRCDLLDRASGRESSIRLPAGERWSMIGVSPARGPGGEPEAAGRWINPKGEQFCGWGLFRLSDGAVLGRIATEILPMGRACWVPDHPRTIVFPAGDGLLYWCRLVGGDEEPVIRRGSPYATGRSEPSEPVAWEVRPPGSGAVFLDNPVWPQEPKLKRWILVGLRQQAPGRDHLVFELPQVWWLEMSDDGKSIVGAGRLTGAAGGASASGVVEERYPNVAVGTDGDIHLVYLERSAREKRWRLRSARLGFDPRTGRPTAKAGGTRAFPDPADDLQPAPLLVSTDGATVYALARSGRLATVPVGQSDGLAKPRQSPE